MKKLVFLIAFLLFVPFAYAGQGMGPGPGCKGYAASGACTTCTGTSDADIFCEDFEGLITCGTGESNCRCTFTVVETGGTATVGNISAGNTCGDKGSKSVVLAKTDAGVVYLSYAATTDNIYLSMMFKYNSSGIGDLSNVYFADIVDSGDNSLMLAGFYRNGSTLYGKFFANGSDVSEYATFSGTGSWVEIKIHFAKGATSTLYIDGTLHASGSVANTSPAKVIIGRIYDDSVNFNFEYDSIKVDDDTQADPCS